MKIGLLLIVVTFGFALFQDQCGIGSITNPLQGKDHIAPLSTPISAASPTPETSVTPIIVETEPNRDPGNSSNDEISAVDLYDIMVGSTDIDCDGVPNGHDNCLLIYNPKQKDKNKNGIGDACEGKPDGKKDFRCDTDKDGVLDSKDNCILVCNPDQKDKNKNGIGDACDPHLLKEWSDGPCPEQKNKKKSPNKTNSLK